MEYTKSLYVLDDYSSLLNRVCTWQSLDFLTDLIGSLEMFRATVDIARDEVLRNPNYCGAVHMLYEGGGYSDGSSFLRRSEVFLEDNGGNAWKLLLKHVEALDTPTSPAINLEKDWEWVMVQYCIVMPNCTNRLIIVTTNSDMSFIGQKV